MSGIINLNNSFGGGTQIDNTNLNIIELLKMHEMK